MSEHTPVELEDAVQGWQRIVCAGLNGSTQLLVICPVCLASVRRDDAIDHINWHHESSRTSERMSAEWWHHEADRYSGLHIAAHKRILRLEMHLRRLVDWGYGSDAPDDAIRDWKDARDFLDATKYAPPGTYWDGDVLKPLPNSPWSTE